jgi:uncharacterized membrane protein
MANKERIKEIMDIFISGCTLALVIVIIATFLTAFFSQNMMIVITINKYGEAWFELLLLILIGLGAVRNLYRQFKDLERLKEKV